MAHRGGSRGRASVSPTRRGPITVRRADLAALLVGLATIGYTVFALLQPAVRPDRPSGAGQEIPGAASAPAEPGGSRAGREPAVVPTDGGQVSTLPAIGTDARSAAPATGAAGGTGESAAGHGGSTAWGDREAAAESDATKPGATRHVALAKRPPAHGAAGNGAPAQGAPGNGAPVNGAPDRDRGNYAGTPERPAPHDDARPVAGPSAAPPPQARQVGMRPGRRAQDPAARPTAGAAPPTASMRMPPPSTSRTSTSRTSTSAGNSPAANPSRTSTAPTARRVVPTVNCSQNSFAPVNVTFVNRSAIALKLDWTDFNCQRRTYAIVPPGGSYPVRSYVTHSWVFVDPSTGFTVGTHVVQFGDRFITMS